MTIVGGSVHEGVHVTEQLTADHVRRVCVEAVWAHRRGVTAGADEAEGAGPAAIGRHCRHAH